MTMRNLILKLCLFMTYAAALRDLPWRQVTLFVGGVCLQVELEPWITPWTERSPVDPNQDPCKVLILSSTETFPPLHSYVLIVLDGG